MRHPAEFFIKAMMIHMPTLTDADVQKRLEDWSFLSLHTTDQKFYLQFLRQSIQLPESFNPTNKLHRPSQRFLRDQQVHEYFWRTPQMEEAYDILVNPDKRYSVEQALMARLDLKMAAAKLNQKKNWLLTEGGLQTYKHFFWNVDLLTFDEWGRFLYGRTALYERQMDLLTATPQLALHLLQIEQQVEGKVMLQDVQRCSYFTFMEVQAKPGTSQDKIKGMAILGKTIIDAHEALSTSDTVLADVLKRFEKFRMERPKSSPPSIAQLAPKGNFTNSGLKNEQDAEVAEA